MSVESSVKIAAGAIGAALSQHALTEAEKEEVERIVGRLMVKTVKKTTHNQVETAGNCCGPEQDLARAVVRFAR